jgi:hypothetical protein
MASSGFILLATRIGYITAISVTITSWISASPISNRDPDSLIAASADRVYNILLNAADQPFYIPYKDTSIFVIQRPEHF